jgi:hypothetical protein
MNQGGVAGGGDGSGQAGTEYTLQGTKLFLAASMLWCCRGAKSMD